MEIILRKITEIVEYLNNSRTHSDDQIGELMNSIKEYGFLDPIEVTEEGILLSGHARLEAAKRLNFTEVPTVCHKHLTAAQKKAYVLAANRIALSAGWDDGMLKEEFELLKGLNFDLSLTGFSDEEINVYLNPELYEDEILEDDAYDITGNIEPICKKGDLWFLGEHRLKCGDSRNPEDVQALLKKDCPILMVTDPPYGVNYDPLWREGVDLGIGKRSKGKVKNDDITDWTESYSLFPGNICYIWHAGNFTHIVSKNIIDCGFDIIGQIIWAKQHFVLSRGNYHWQHEPCIYAVKSGKKHNWQGKRDQSTLWEIKNNNSFGNYQKEETWGHGTQKPVECMARPIQNNSRINDYVYDPFGGSGTTLIACEKLKRRCLMMEL